MSYTDFNPELDLVLERVVDVRPQLIWKAWTEPEYLKQWFVPAPWTIADCSIDLRPGGEFSFVMRSPDGEEHPSTGCILEIVEGRKLVWTDALLPDYRPAPEPFFSAIVTLEPEGEGTRYTATAVHGNTATRKTHEDMGFQDGWSTCLDQLVELVSTLE